jgi:SAM-dependent methyltransferase
VVVCVFRPLAAIPAAGIVSADEALLRVRRACQRLTPYWRHYGTAKLKYDPVYRQLAEQTMPWGRVLDAGCGPGLIAALAAVRHEPAYYGIDLDGDKLEAAVTILDRLNRPLDGDWRFLQACLPLAHDPPNRFDSIMIIDVLHYWPVTQQALVLRQLRAALAEHGTLWLRDGISDTAGNTGTVGLSEQFTTFFGLNPGANGLHFLSEGEMRALLTSCGFTIVSCLLSGKENRLWRCIGQAAVSESANADVAPPSTPISAPTPS